VSRPPPVLEPLRTRIGLAVAGDNRLWGRSLRDEIVGRTSLSGLAFLAVTGRLLPAEDCLLLDDLVAVHMVVDIRIWPLKLERVLSSFGRSPSAFVSAQLACASEAMGPLLAGKCARFLLELEREVDEQASNENAIIEAIRRRLENKERIAGFGAPFRRADERLVAFRESVARRGRSTGRYWDLAVRVAHAGMAAGNLPANIVLFTAALLLDLGVREDQCGDLMMGLVSTLFLAGAHEGARQAEPQLRRLPDDAVEYLGPPPRRSPRAEEAEGGSQAAPTTGGA